MMVLVLGLCRGVFDVRIASEDACIREIYARQRSVMDDVHVNICVLTFPSFPQKGEGTSTHLSFSNLSTAVDKVVHFES